MKILTIYELIKLIKEDKAPKKVKYKETFYIYNEKLQDYADIDEFYLIYEICNEIHCWLDEEVEIIEDKEKAIINLGKMGFVYEVEDKNQNANNERFKDFINEIIDIVNDLKKEGKSE